MAAGRVLPAMAFALASGACALVYQIAWTRELRLVFGASTPASAAVVAVFLGGLGLGAWIIGSRAERSERPLLVYGALELAVAASSAATPWLIALAMRAYLATGGSVVLGAAMATLARLALSAIVLGVPTVLMGGTLPALARFAIARNGDPRRRSVAALYGLNTLGAFAGCVAATFALIERFGNHRTLWLAAGLNAVVGLAAILRTRRVTAAPEPRPDDEDEPEVQTPTAPAAMVLAASCVVGFAFFLMELVFYRMLGPLLGGSVYTFGLVLAVALLGIGIGGVLYAIAWARKTPSLSALAITCLLEALGLAVPYGLGDRIALLAIDLRGRVVTSFLQTVDSWLVVTAIVVLPAAIVSGVQFPMLVAMLGRGRVHVARHVGLAYAANTAGAVAGAIAGGFGLMRLFGAVGCWRAVVWLLALTGLTAAVLARRTRRPWIAALVQVSLAVAVGALVIRTPGPTAAWRHSPIGIGWVSADDVSSPEKVESFLRDARRSVAWEADGVESTVAVLRNHGYAFIVNAKSDGHCRIDAGTQVMGPMLGAMLHPAPHSAMVIGLGSGSSAGWLASVPGIERVDAVEIEPAMLEVARLCAPVNRDALSNPRVHVAIGDAREVLSATPSRYDLVFSEPSNPYRAGVASLFTREFYERVAGHLNDRGLFLQWVQAYEIDERTMKTIFATAAGVYPYVEIWQLRPPDLMLVASRAPIAHDVAALRARVAEEPFAEALRVSWGVDDLEGALGHFVATPAWVRDYARDAADRLNTDDRPLVEFSFAWIAAGAGGNGREPNADSLRDVAHHVHGDLPEVENGAVDWPRLAAERAEIPCYDGERPYDLPEDASKEVRARVAFEDLWQGHKDKEALAHLAEHPIDRPTPMEALDTARLAVREKSDRAGDWIDRLATTAPVEALVLRAEILRADGHTEEAAADIERALVAYRTNPWPSHNVMRDALYDASMLADSSPSLGPRMFELLVRPFAIDMLRDDRLRWATIARFGGPPDARCRDVLAQAEPNVVWEPHWLQYRRDCYAATLDPRLSFADADLARYRANEAAAPH